MQFHKFKLLFFKNAKSSLRSGSDLFWEFFLPAAMACLLLWIRGLASTEIIDEPTVYEPYDLDMWPAGLEPPYLDQNGKSEFILAYYPENQNTSQIMNNVVGRLLDSVSLYTKQKQFIDQGMKLLSDSDFETIKKYTDKVKIFGNFTTKFQAEYQSNPAKFIDKYIKPEIEGFLWNPCLRQTIFNAIEKLTSEVVCDLGPRIDLGSYTKHLIEKLYY